MRKLGLCTFLLAIFAYCNSGSSPDARLLPAHERALLGPAITIGETRTLTLDDNGNANLLSAQNATLSQAATIQSISIYVPQAAGNLRLGIYDATGTNGRPGAKKAETASFKPVVGWNTVNVVAPVLLAAGNYWLAYVPSSNSLHYRKALTSGVSIVYYQYTFGALPATFGKTLLTDPYHWSFYATLNTADGSVDGSVDSMGGSGTGGAGTGGAGTGGVGTGGSGTGGSGGLDAPIDVGGNSDSADASNDVGGTVGTGGAIGTGGASGADGGVGGVGGAPLLHVSANHRYLEDPNGNAVYLIGDAAWTLVAGLTVSQAATYFQTRAGQGFNAVILDANLYLNASPLGAPAAGPADASGNLPFNGYLPGGDTFDVSTVPAPGDTTSTAGKYWQNVDAIIAAAASSGIQVLFNTFDNYAPWFSNSGSPNSAAKLTAYGQFLGQRYVNVDNIIWMIGDDYVESSAGDASFAAVMQGVRQYDTRHVGWAFNEYGATFDNTGLRSYLSLNSIYTTAPQRALYLSQYNRSDFGPLFNIECSYENNTPIDTLREQHYSFLLNGACGDIYGNEYVWPFAATWHSWQNALTSEGGQEMAHFASLVRSIPWYTLVPDQTATVFQGLNSPNDYSGAYTPGGTLAVAYRPATGYTSQNVVVNMGYFAGQVTARWFDPTAGTYTAAGTWANTGTHTFSSPAMNSSQLNDFVLLLQVQ